MLLKPKTLNPERLVATFWTAPDEALFDQKTIAAVRDCSESLCERDRWAGKGPRFVKQGRLVRYRKSDVVEWLNSHQTFSSTSQYSETRAGSVAA